MLVIYNEDKPKIVGPLGMLLGEAGINIANMTLGRKKAGGQAITEDLGIKLENVTVDMLGRAKKVIITKEETTIVDGAGKKADIVGRCNQIRAQVLERLAHSLLVSVGCVVDGDKEGAEVAGGRSLPGDRRLNGGIVLRIGAKDGSGR